MLVLWVASRDQCASFPYRLPPRPCRPVLVCPSSATQSADLVRPGSDPERPYELRRRTQPLTCNGSATKMAPDMEILVAFTTIPKIEYGLKVLFLQEVMSAPSFGRFGLAKVPTRR